MELKPHDKPSLRQPGDFAEQSQSPATKPRVTDKLYRKYPKRYKPEGSGIVPVKYEDSRGHKRTKLVAKPLPDGWDDRRVDALRNTRARQRAAGASVNASLKRAGAVPIGAMHRQHDKPYSEQLPSERTLRRTRAMLVNSPTVELSRVKSVDAKVARLDKQIASARTHERKRELRRQRAKLLRSA